MSNVLIELKSHAGDRDRSGCGRRAAGRRRPIGHASRFVLLFLVLVGAGGLYSAHAQDVVRNPDRPNILIIIADDATYSDLPLHGGVNVETPRIDRLAEEGLVFNRAYQSMSMCVPTRSELYTGLYPVSNGSAWNHSPVRPGTKSIVHHLGDLGYRVGIAGKVHVGPRKAFPFEMVPGVERSPVAETASFDPAGMIEFMERSRTQPFALVIGLNSPHMPWTVGDPSHYDPERLELPDLLVDTPVTRDYMARYLAEIEVLDEQVGRALDALQSVGKEDDTVVLFTSEQGAQWPGAKWTNWEPGVRTALVARWPGRVEAGTRTDAIVHYADVLPTLVDAAGGDPGRYDFDGRSFLAVLDGNADSHRDYAYSMHNNVPEGPPYPIRSVTDGEFRYIQNLTPDAVYIEKHVFGLAEHTGYWGSWMFAAADRAEADLKVQRYMHRPAEELYHTTEDPSQLNNLADNPAYIDVKIRLRDALSEWMRSEGDAGAALDTRAALAERREEAEAWQNDGQGGN